MRKLFSILLLSAFTLVGCTDASRAKLGGYNSQFKVQLLNCEGEVVREWISSGKVLSEANSDGYFFNDQKTGVLTEVTGTLVITKIK